MTLEEFQQRKSPEKLSPLLQALWHARQGNWPNAHDIAQDIYTREGAWIHAYLHRQEGDPSNASYWYRQAGRPPSQLTLEQEWEEIATELLARE
ncbi:MAG: hypothetical protein K2U26_10120 [Cyclobacteriaceae bacterium]|nr:hypothetical protein [Cyclobacteriaceae bacterium]